MARESKGSMLGPQWDLCKHSNTDLGSNSSPWLVCLQLCALASVTQQFDLQKRAAGRSKYASYFCLLSVILSCVFAVGLAADGRAGWKQAPRSASCCFVPFGQTGVMRF